MPDPDRIQLVLLETGSNQRYLFETNKLAEAVGASELIRRSTVDWVFDWLGGQGLGSEDARIERDRVEVVLASSGKTMLLVRDPDVAREVVFAVTARALAEAPGLRLYGAASDPFDWSRPGALHGAIRQAHHELSLARARVPGPELRFLRLPPVAECQSSGLPAAHRSRVRSEEAARSHQSLAKLSACDEGWEKMVERLEGARRERGARQRSGRREDEVVESLEGAGRAPGLETVRLARHLGEVESTFLREDVKWSAVLYADGNGLGRIFFDFEEALAHDRAHDPQDNRHYVDRLRDTSEAIDYCARIAVVDAIDDTWPSTRRSDASEPGNGAGPVATDHWPALRPIPVVPLVLGGDDLSVVCHGQRAVHFAKQIALRFCEATRGDERLRPVAPRGLGMAAGVAVTKPHHPFSSGHLLAGQLLRSAKLTKVKVVDGEGMAVPCASVDFHVLFDSAVADLDRLRRLHHGSVRLSGGPFVVDAERPADVTDVTWWQAHQFAALEEAVEALLEEDEEGRRLLPNTQVHELRQALHVSREAGQRQYDRLRSRYGASTRFTVGPLYFTDVPNGERADVMTRVIDAMTLADLERADRNRSRDGGAP